MSLKLHTFPGNFRAFKILIAAEYQALDVEVVTVEVPNETSKANFLALSPLGRVPVLETEQGNIFESNAIARYIARLRRDTEIYGASFYESGLVDSWVDFASNEVELPATVWVYPVLGYLPYIPEATEKGKNDLARSLNILNNHLADKTYLVGDRITLADITVVSALVYPFKLVASPDYLAPFAHVVRWFTTCVNQEQFISIIGKVVFAQAELTPSGVEAQPAKEQKKEVKENKKENKKDEKKADKPKESPKKSPKVEDKPKEEKIPELELDDNGMPVVKKEDHVLKVLDNNSPSPMYLDTWKKLYSNTSNYDDAMRQFWEMLDNNGWSLWRCDYNYNNENVKLFMTCNLVSGFLQRTNDVRKWAFGCMWILGEEGKSLEVTGLWLIRGKTIKPLLDANDDAAYYTWTEFALPASDEIKAKTQELWCSEGTIEGKPICDYKCFK